MAAVRFLITKGNESHQPPTGDQLVSTYYAIVLHNDKSVKNLLALKGGFFTFNWISSTQNNPEAKILSCEIQNIT